MSKKRFRASIVCAVDDELLDPTRWFHVLYNQTIPRDEYEVLIIDAYHQTTHQEEFERYRREHDAKANVSYHRIPKGGRAKSFNHAIEMAGSNLIIFLGDDCLAPLDFVESHIRFHHEHPEASAVAIGPALFPSELRTPFTHWLEQSGRLWGVPFDGNLSPLPVDFFYVANASVKRELLEHAGHFDERFKAHAWDDFEFGQRLAAAGMKAELLPDSVVWHLHKIDLASRASAMLRAGVAAKTYFASRPNEVAWPDSFKAKFHWCREALAKLRLRLNPGEQARKYWWGVQLDAAFIKGYRNHHNGHHSV